MPNSAESKKLNLTITELTAEVIGDNRLKKSAVTAGVKQLFAERHSGEFDELLIEAGLSAGVTAQLRSHMADPDADEQPTLGKGFENEKFILGENMEYVRRGLATYADLEASLDRRIRSREFDTRRIESCRAEMQALYPYMKGQGMNYEQAKAALRLVP